jgi:hydrogenase-1 operon protein HyaE
MCSFLIEQLVARHGYPLADADSLDGILGRETTLALFLTEDPARFPESNDVAVILPELVQAFPGRFEPVVVARGLESQLKDRYDIAVWPCLVFLRNGRFLGKISKVRDWSEYMQRIPEILAGETRHNPGVGIPVVNQAMGQTHA